MGRIRGEPSLGRQAHLSLPCRGLVGYALVAVAVAVAFQPGGGSLPA